jgi:hypothetical protein
MAGSALDRLQELREQYVDKLGLQPWLEDYYRRLIADLDERIRRLQPGEHKGAELIAIAEKLTAKQKIVKRKKIPFPPSIYTYLGPYGESRIRHWSGRKYV